MTEHKHLKRRVRERMAKTGESYTAALRHLTGPRRPYHHHESALLRRLLGGAYSEALLLGLGGGVGFMYFVFEYSGRPPILTVVAQAHPAPMIPLALSRLRIPFEVVQTGSPRVAERNLREALAAGPVVCRVGRYQLPWRPDLPFPDPVDVAVTAIEGDRVTLDDDGPRELPLADFMAAWSRVRKERHTLIRITGGPEGEPDVAGAIADTAAKLTGPVLGNAFDVNFGLSGMRKLAAQIPSWDRRWEDLAVPLRRLHECLEVEYTTPGATRPLYADFLAEVGRPDGLYRAAGEQWSRVAAAALATAPLGEIARLVGHAVQLEERAVAELAGVS
ncbi:BtrH N-terminal domain-containing protein [Thermoactinospora rubra]|uniref:BtrH N-terminal domain-containing protein n=1 Tax=Thermoactinospora rubra TaxID=1088767 RepID=UPI00117FF538|nr:BtrH N-terminal domain-containing protein [Thermoactinospora rubra]